MNEAKLQITSAQQMTAIAKVIEGRLEELRQKLFPGLKIDVTETGNAVYFHLKSVTITLTEMEEVLLRLADFRNMHPKNVGGFIATQFTDGCSQPYVLIFVKME